MKNTRCNQHVPDRPGLRVWGVLGTPSAFPGLIRDLKEPIVSIVVPFFGLTYFFKDPKR